MAWDWQSINWAPVVITTLSTGILTALGAGIGAYWGGRPLVNHAKRNYVDDKKERAIEELTNLYLILEADFYEVSKLYNQRNTIPLPIIDTKTDLHKKLARSSAIVSSLISIHFDHVKEELERLLHYLATYLEARGLYTDTIRENPRENTNSALLTGKQDNYKVVRESIMDTINNLEALIKKSTPNNFPN